MAGPAVVMEEAWREYAACRGTDPGLFYPENGDGDSGREAKKICAVCTVRRPCREYAEANEVDGIWAGLAVYQIRRRKYRKAPPV